MDKDFYGNIITLTDENGDDIDFEIIESCEIDGTEYFAIVPAGSLEDSSDLVDYNIVKNITDEDGEEFIVSIDDDGEFEKVAHRFDEIFEAELE